MVCGLLSNDMVFYYIATWNSLLLLLKLLMRLKNKSGSIKLMFFPFWNITAYHFHFHIYGTVNDCLGEFYMRL